MISILILTFLSMAQPSIPSQSDQQIKPARLEILDVFTGARTVIYENEIGFEAPNWMPDNSAILFNQEGKILSIPITGGKPAEIDTDFAVRCNNDHVISWSGETLVISHDTDEGSKIYTLPVTGGEPKLITPESPSYLHGISPDDLDIVYVAKRESETDYNIFKTNINTLTEERLTSNQGFHVDGPEYSPDGKYIYYNGSKSGTMQIWRMKSDGTGHEQLTFGSRNAWFPHISPDNQWVVYISFPESVPVNDHPRNREVKLHLMKVDEWESTVIAELFGGQGTINVPSWSPDSKRIAFVSYVP